MANPSEGILESLVIELGKRIDCNDLNGTKELLVEVQKRVHDYEIEANNAHVKYILSRTPINKKREGKIEMDFENWQKMITVPLMKEAGATRSYFFRFVMDQMLVQRPGFRKVPFFYYDFYSKKAVYTPGALELFGIDQKTSEEIPLKVLTRGIIPEHERKMLTDELKSGKRIKDYSLKTSNYCLNQIVVNAYPLLYERKPVGFGVLLYSPGLDLKISKKRYEIFENGVEELIGRISKGFQVIKEESKKSV